VLNLARSTPRPFTAQQIELAETFADQAVIAIENVRLFEAEQQRTTDLTESLQQQTATSEILDVISNSPTDSQPAFDAIVRSGLKLFPEAAIMIGLRDGDLVRSATVADTDPAGAEALRARMPLPLSREFITSTAILDRREVDLPDAREAPAELAAGARNFLASGYRAMTVVPMMRGEAAIGTVNVIRRRPGPLSEKQRELLRIFANQAVIAIENTRLFNELRQSLEQQTATADVLRVISSSPTNVQPVFDSIAESAVRLCGGQFSFVVRFDGKVMNYASCFGLSAEGLSVFRGIFPLTAGDDTVSGRAILHRAIVEVPDVEVDAAYGVQAQRLARTVAYRSIVAVPLLHEGDPIGAIAVARANAGSFPERQITLLQAFADQAVIAIRNVRLFDEVQARTEELSESLQQQTATAEVLKLITRSTFNLQTVLDTLIQSAASLCEADLGYIGRPKGDGLFQAEASYGLSPAHKDLVDRTPWRAGRESAIGRVLLERTPIHIVDVETDPEYRMFEIQKAGGYHSVFGVPLLREGTLIGVLVLARRSVRPFTDKQIELVQTPTRLSLR